MFKDNPFLDRDQAKACAEKTYAEQYAAGQYAGQCANSPIGYAARSLSDNEVIEKLFTYQPPSFETNRQYETIREAAKYFAKVIMANVPAGADRLSAVRKVREAVMTANAGIALDGVGL